MTEKNIALVGLVVLFVACAAAMAFAQDAEAVAKIFLMATIGAGTIVNLWRLGANTEKTDKIEKSVNGLSEARIESAYREAFARGILAGAQAEEERVARELVTKTAAAMAAAALKTLAEKKAADSEHTA